MMSIASCGWSDMRQVSVRHPGDWAIIRPMHIFRFRPLTALPLLLLLAACATPSSRSVAAAQPPPAVIAETYVSPESPGET
jgi:hypothetical protein